MLTLRKLRLQERFEININMFTCRSEWDFCEDSYMTLLIQTNNWIDLKSEQLVWSWKMSSLILMMIFEFMLTCLWDLWCCGLRIFIKIDFWSFSFTVLSQFHHSDHMNQWMHWCHVWKNHHKIAILTEFDDKSCAEYENDKRKIRDQQEKRNKNSRSDKNWNSEQSEQEQIEKLLKSFTRNQVVY